MTSLYCILKRTYFQFAQFRTRKYSLAMIGTFRKEGLLLAWQQREEEGEVQRVEMEERLLHRVAV